MFRIKHIFMKEEVVTCSFISVSRECRCSERLNLFGLFRHSVWWLPSVCRQFKDRRAYFHPIRSGSLYWYHTGIKSVLNPAMKLIPRWLKRAQSAKSVAVFSIDVRWQNLNNHPLAHSMARFFWETVYSTILLSHLLSSSKNNSSVSSKIVKTSKTIIISPFS